MTPAPCDIEFRRGDTFRLAFRLRYRNPDKTPGAYVDLTNWGNGLAQVRSKKDDSVVVTMTITKMNQANPDTMGGILITVPHTTVSALDFDELKSGGKWDFEIANELGEVDTYLEGGVTFIKDVSRL